MPPSNVDDRPQPLRHDRRAAAAGNADGRGRPSSSARSTGAGSRSARSRTPCSLGGGIALLLAFVFSWLIAKRVTRPIEELAGIAQAVTGGDYTRPPTDRPQRRGRNPRPLLREDDHRPPRQGRDRRALRADGRDVGGAGGALGQPRLGEPAETRRGNGPRDRSPRVAVIVGEGDAANVIGAVSRAMKLQEAEVARQDGIRPRNHRPPARQRLPRRSRHPARHPRRSRHQRRAGHAWASRGT